VRAIKLTKLPDRATVKLTISIFLEGDGALQKCKKRAEKGSVPSCMMR
jgi:hypothetical protein